MDANGASDPSHQVHVRFVTKLPPPLRAPTTSLAVPAELSRMGLSEIVNSLLAAAEPDHQPQPFDFLVDNELVRIPLQQFLNAKGISAERVLELEYVKAVAPRKQEDPCPHDDWVSAVDGSSRSFILTGCYDGLARIWKGSACTHILEGHTGAITYTRFINKGVETEGSLHVVTGSKDRSLRLFKSETSVNMNHLTRIRAYKFFVDTHHLFKVLLETLPKKCFVRVPGTVPSSCGLLKDLKKMVTLYQQRREGLTLLNLKTLSGAKPEKLIAGVSLVMGKLHRGQGW